MYEPSSDLYQRDATLASAAADSIRCGPRRLHTGQGQGRGIGHVLGIQRVTTALDLVAVDLRSSSTISGPRSSRDGRSFASVAWPAANAPARSFCASGQCSTSKSRLGPSVSRGNVHYPSIDVVSSAVMASRPNSPWSDDRRHRGVWQQPGLHLHR
jgi:hypothetical protein